MFIVNVEIYIYCLNGVNFHLQSCISETNTYIFFINYNFFYDAIYEEHFPTNNLLQLKLF